MPGPRAALEGRAVDRRLVLEADEGEAHAQAGVPGFQDRVLRERERGGDVGLGRRLGRRLDFLFEGEAGEQVGAVLRHLDRHRADALLERQAGGAVLRRDPAQVRQHRGGADRRVPGEGQFRLGREDAHLGRVARVLGRQHEGGLGEVELARDRLHGAGREARGLGQHGELVAAERGVREHVGDDEAVRGGHRDQRRQNGFAASLAASARLMPMSLSS
jgi:hypothetical protein